MNKHRRKKSFFLFLSLLVVQLSCQRSQEHRGYSGYHTEVSNDLPIKLLWSYASTVPIKVPPRSNQDTLVILESNGAFKGFDLKTGDIQWEYATGLEAGWPSSDRPYDVNNDLLVTVVNNRFLIALDAHEGKELWRIQLNSASEAVPDILLIDNVVIISSPSVETTTEGYVVGYDLDTQKLIFERYYPPRSFGHSFSCASLHQRFRPSEYMICVSQHGYLEVIDFDPKLQNGFARVLGRIDWGFATLDRPYFKEGYIFSIDSPKPAIQVIDVEQSDRFALFHGCETKKAPKPIQSYNGTILASTGCNEVYTINIDSINEEPSWVFRSVDDLRSPFLTPNGSIGYFLNARAEIIGIDLDTGETVGKFTTTPANLNDGRYLNALINQYPYLYAFFNGRQVFVFKEE